ncbi:gp37 [Sphingomonas phage PAU]|uniref:dCMP deaminase n=1 Tax=Sphingomonas phage PAU TaxID=1150991 RepID=UPI000257312A|nr:dCMP deaminase [Sphingomonas phage PAU]AFF28035.1 gp37 [Sphingomonas phage PAU]
MKAEKLTNEHHSYMRMAKTWADDQSYAKRRKVGALVVKDGQILSHGHNGTISGFNNACEDETEQTYNEHVLHAESNTLMKLARNGGNGSNGAIMYCTDTPCVNCAKLIKQSGIKTFYYEREYWDLSGLDLLLMSGVEVIRIDSSTGLLHKLDLKDDASYFRKENLGLVHKMDRTIEELFMKLNDFWGPKYYGKLTNGPTDVLLKRNKIVIKIALKKDAPKEIHDVTDEDFISTMNSFNLDTMFVDESGNVSDERSDYRSIVINVTTKDYWDRYERDTLFYGYKLSDIAYIKFEPLNPEPAVKVNSHEDVEIHL